MFRKHLVISGPENRLKLQLRFPNPSDSRDDCAESGMNQFSLALLSRGVYDFQPKVTLSCG
jgi:hypothetical protein